MMDKASICETKEISKLHQNKVDCVPLCEHLWKYIGSSDLKHLLTKRVKFTFKQGLQLFGIYTIGEFISMFYSSFNFDILFGLFDSVPSILLTLKDFYLR